MNLLEYSLIHCPYCGEASEFAIDCSIATQSYIEDCPICCRPITLKVTCLCGESPQVTALREDEC
jgi:hypothetical protein